MCLLTVLRHCDQGAPQVEGKSPNFRERKIQNNHFADIIQIDA